MTLGRMVMPLVLVAAVDATAADTAAAPRDPFFQVTAADPACPTPAGPSTDPRDLRAQAHHRAERGTSCWLAGRCARPNAYDYDTDIAVAVRHAFADAAPAFADSSLWVTVQGRIVFVEGCVARADEAARIESLVAAQPAVERAVAIVRTDPATAPPYRTRATPPGTRSPSAR